MTDAIRLLVDILGPLWPLRIVWEWQQGLYYLAGRYQGTVGPGLKVVVPYLCEVRMVAIVPEIYTTPLQTITMRDGKTLTYSASLTVIVTDANLAYNRLGHHSESIVELSGRIISEGLADADPERFDPARGKRDRLIDDQRKAINDACRQYGLEVTALGLNNFALGVRTVRLLLDKAVLSEGNHATV